MKAKYMKPCVECVENVTDKFIAASDSFGLFNDQADQDLITTRRGTWGDLWFIDNTNAKN